MGELSDGAAACGGAPRRLQEPEAPTAACLGDLPLGYEAESLKANRKWRADTPRRARAG